MEMAKNWKDKSGLSGSPGDRQGWHMESSPGNVEDLGLTHYIVGIILLLL
jgi:hypothetical protein